MNEKLKRAAPYGAALATGIAAGNLTAPKEEIVYATPPAALALASQKHAEIEQKRVEIEQVLTSSTWANAVAHRQLVAKNVCLVVEVELDELRAELTKCKCPK